MMEKPVIKSINYSEQGIRNLRKDLDATERDVILNQPTVYVINQDYKKKSSYRVYVGETNDVIQRTEQHLQKSTDKVNEMDDADMYIIGNLLFQKSMTLDIENRMIEYLIGAPDVFDIELLNARGNDQSLNYSGKDKTDEVFRLTIDELNKRDPKLFPKFSDVATRAIFKSSPFKSLNEEQEKTKDLILSTVAGQVTNKATGQLILVEGAAGTGKTVLLSRLFYDLASREFAERAQLSQKLKVALVVNHKEQVKVYSNLVDKLKTNFGTPDFIVGTPTQLLNRVMNHGDEFDVALIDEAHLVMTQPNKGAWTHKLQNFFNATEQISAIQSVAKTTIAIFDPNQILRADQSWDEEAVKKLRQQATTCHELTTQMRMEIDAEDKKWIDEFVNGELREIPGSTNYEIKAFSNVVDMFDEIKSKNDKFGLSRMLATYDWEWDKDGEWFVEVDGLSIPWNYTAVKEKKKITWAEDPETIVEVGSTFTIQGFDLNYAGVILGPSIKYRDGHIVIDDDENKSFRAAFNRKIGSAGTEKHLRDALNVLMTRAVRGLYIYAVDDELRSRLLGK